MRKSFESGYLPDEVLWRQKEAFSDGISSNEESWYEILQKYIDTLITDKEFYDNKYKYIHCPPETKEAYYYRKIFCELFDDKYSNVIPNFWMPNWTETSDPSARTISSVYKSS